MKEAEVLLLWRPRQKPQRPAMRLQKQNRRFLSRQQLMSRLRPKPDMRQRRPSSKRLLIPVRLKHLWRVMNLRKPAMKPYHSIMEQKGEDTEANMDRPFLKSLRYRASLLSKP